MPIETDAGAPAGGAGGSSPQRAGSYGRRRRRWWWLTAAVLAAALAAAAVATSNSWLPRVQTLLSSLRPAADQPAPRESPGETDHDHEGHEHESAQEGADHAGHVAGSGEQVDDHDAAGPPADAWLVLSPQAQKNIGLTLHTAERRDYERTMAIPAVLAERPGRSEITVSAPMTGIITRIYPIRGEAVAPGEPLFELRLTHEDVVEKQSELLRDLEQLDVIQQEIARLEEVTRSGAVAGKTLLERGYDRQKIEGAIRAEREALLLHGLSEQQIETIQQQRQLVRTILVLAPEADKVHAEGVHADFFQVAELAVKRGEHVVTGTPLARLTDHCELHIEGRAFEQDVEALTRAANQELPVSALIQTGDDSKRQVTGLRVLYVENQVERDSRALKFYVPLPNDLLRNEKQSDGHRFIAWRYRPGQRVDVLVPARQWSDRIMLPVASVIQDGSDWFVYRLEGNRFVRRSVDVEYRDQQWVVVQADTTLQPGDQVVAQGAYQVHLAMKNKLGGGLDPHAGHNH